MAQLRPRCCEVIVARALSGRAAFRRNSALEYYGIGNASADEDPEGVKRFNQLDRWFPLVEGTLRFEVAESVEVFTRTLFQYNRINMYDGSKLEQDARGAGPALAESLLVGVSEHGLAQQTAGIVFDTRDNEVDPQRGMLHDVSAEGGVGMGERFGYGRLHATARFYVPLYDKYLTGAGRLLGDLLLGRPPFYELARSGGLFPIEAPGGAEGIRGVPAGRYHGKVKVIGNVELRARLLWFSIADEQLSIGAAAFADTGRIWTEAGTDTRLDGDSVGLKVGTGGGLRVFWGTTFIFRIDGAWSPDGTGFYATAHHTF